MVTESDNEDYDEESDTETLLNYECFDLFLCQVYVYFRYIYYNWHLITKPYHYNHSYPYNPPP